MKGGLSCQPLLKFKATNVMLNNYGWQPIVGFQRTTLNSWKVLKINVFITKNTSVIIQTGN